MKAWLQQTCAAVASLMLFGALVGCAGPQAVDEVAQSQALGQEEAQSPNAQDPEPVEVDPNNPPDGFETMEVFRVVPAGEGAAVLLVDQAERMVVPIFVGRTIGMTIQLRLERQRYARPLTHDLLDEMVEQLGGQVIKVHIDDVKSGVFVGTVYVRDPAGEVLTFDSRSSDAVALALGNSVPIFVSRDVVEKAGVDTDELDDGEVPPGDVPDGPQTQPL